MGLFDSLFGRAKDDEATVQEALRKLSFCRWFDSQCRTYCSPEQTQARERLEAEAEKLLRRNGWTKEKLAELPRAPSTAGKPPFVRRDFEKYVGGWFQYRKRVEDSYYEELKDLHLSTSQVHDVLKEDGWGEGEIRRFLLRFTRGARAAAEALAPPEDEPEDKA
ncbi:MAG: hypothetical protein HYZ53_21060 [Planctomycetes bacterium]|nr:hypothetical protein [Planctomycetota bacterium]